MKLNNLLVKKKPAGKYGDGAGLLLVKNSKEKGKWVFRFTFNKKSRQCGLGSYPEVSLKEAREKAQECRQMLAQGIDPIIEKKRPKLKIAPNLTDMIYKAFEAHKYQLKDQGKAGRWLSPLEIHVIPIIGHMPVNQITQYDLHDCLKKLWFDKHETAQKAFNRISIVLDYAAAGGVDLDLQIVKKAKLLLGKQVKKVKNIPSMPYQQVPAFYKSLYESFLGPLALKMLILTGARSKPVRLMRWEQIENAIWTIPAENMKGVLGKVQDFRIPLSQESLRILEIAKELGGENFVFSKTACPLSDMTLSKILKDRDLEYRPHGFRSSLRNWMAEIDGTPYEIAETVLSHSVGSSVQRAYLRTDFLEQRLEVMERWAQYLIG